MARIDWPAVRRDYVEGRAVNPDGDPNARTWPTLEELATLHPAGISTIRTRSAREHWPDLRSSYQAEIEAGRKRQLIEQRGEQAAALDRRALTNAEAGMSLIGMRLSHMVTTEAAKPLADRGQRLEGSELASLGLAARRWLQVKAAVLGQPDIDTPSIDELERQALVAETLVAARLAEHLAEHVRAEAEHEADAVQDA